MPHIAYLLIGDPNPTRALAWAEELGAGGYRCITATDPHSLIALTESQQPDVVLIGDYSAPVDSLSIAQALKEADATSQIPVVLLDASANANLMTGAREIGIDDVFVKGESLDEVVVRLPRLTRSSIMSAELRRRVATAAEFGVAVDPRTYRRGYPERPLVMTVARDQAVRERMAQTLNEDGLDSTVEESPFKAADGLDDGRYDAAVISIGPKDDFGPAQYMCGHIRNNPRLFNLPTLVLQETTGNGGDNALYRGGAAIVLSSPTAHEHMATYIHMLIARQRLRWTMRDPFKATLARLTADKTGKCYSRAFWDRHSETLVRTANERSSSLAVGYITSPTLARVRDEYGDDSAEILAHQLADWITGMTRIEDLVARVDKDSFGILLPGTPEKEANRVVQRIVGILHRSEFHLGEEVMKSISTLADAGTSGIQKSDTHEDMLERARKAAI